MNKHISYIKNLLKENTYRSEKGAKDYLANVISENKLTPKFETQHQASKKDSHNSLAITLNTDVLGSHSDKKITVYGRVHEDYYTWVNFFLVVSDDGKSYIVGDFEELVYSSSESFYENFVEDFGLDFWDYGDI